MNTVLYIKANAKPEGMSRTFKISDSFVNEYQNNNPQDRIITLDLYKEGISFLTKEDIAVIFGPKTEESRKNRVLKYAYQFAEADKYILAEPMWNFGMPAIMKAYFDYVCIKDIAFKYTETGVAGLLSGKKAVNIVTRGGDYCSEPACFYELGDRYIKTIFAFFGITDYTTIFVDQMDIIGQDVDKIVEGAIKDAVLKAKSF